MQLYRKIRALNREIIYFRQAYRGKRAGGREYLYKSAFKTTAGCFRSASDFRITQNDH